MKKTLILIVLVLLLVLVMAGSALAASPKKTPANILDAYGWHENGWTYVTVVWDTKAGDPDSVEVDFGGFDLNVVSVDLTKKEAKAGEIVLGMPGTYYLFWASVNNRVCQSTWEHNDDGGGIIP